MHFYGYYVPVSDPRLAAPQRAKALFTDRAQFLQMVLKAIFNERAAQQFYRTLHDRATTPFEKRNIQHAYTDEVKHERMLTEMYRALTNTAPQVPHPGPEEVADFEEGLKKAFEDELEAAEMYRTMLLMTFAQPLRDPLFELMTDEMEHAQRFTFLRAER